MLTKEQIGLICGVKVGADLYLTEEMIAEVRRLALLGLEREESRARVEAAAEADTHVELSVLDDSFGAFPDLGLGPDLDLGPEPHEAFLTEERDRERAERVGKLVLSWRCGTCGMDAVKLYGGFVRTCDRCGPALKRAIADAMEEP